jgi:hypothetical protein
MKTNKKTPIGSDRDSRRPRPPDMACSPSNLAVLQACPIDGAIPMPQDAGAAAADDVPATQYYSPTAEPGHQAVLQVSMVTWVTCLFRSRCVVGRARAGPGPGRAQVWTLSITRCEIGPQSVSVGTCRFPTPCCEIGPKSVSVGTGLFSKCRLERWPPAEVGPGRVTGGSGPGRVTGGSGPGRVIGGRGPGRVTGGSGPGRAVRTGANTYTSRVHRFDLFTVVEQCRSGEPSSLPSRVRRRISGKQVPPIAVNLNGQDGRSAI